jgi:hypothetical protein
MEEVIPEAMELLETVEHWVTLSLETRSSRNVNG